MFITFSILFTFSFCLSVSHVKAAPIGNVAFDGRYFNFAITVNNDFKEYLEKNNLDYFITFQESSYNPYAYLVFFDKEVSSKISFKDRISSSYRYLNVYNISDVDIQVNGCDLRYSGYNDDNNYFGKNKCFEKIDKTVNGKTTDYIVKPNEYVVSNTNISAFSSVNTDLKYLPFYTSYEDIPLLLESDFTVKYLENEYDFTTLTTKDLFYANHYELFKDKTVNSGSADLSKIEMMLYFVCFFIFIFFIILVFKLTFKFIHAILPI